MRKSNASSQGSLVSESLGFTSSSASSRHSPVASGIFSMVEIVPVVYTESFPRNAENVVRIIQKPDLLMQQVMPIFSDLLFSYNNLSCTHLLEKLCLKDFLSLLINNKTVRLDKL